MKCPKFHAFFLYLNDVGPNTGDKPQSGGQWRTAARFARRVDIRLV
jgi:hypothetical protein